MTYLTKNYTEISELKRDYFRLAKKIHPDHGGDVEKMKALNNEYEKLVTTIPTKASQKSENGSVRYYSYDSEFIDMVNELLKVKKSLPFIEIEVCGFFIYVTGTKKENRKVFNKEGLGLLWNSKKLAWYYKPAWYSKKGGKTWDMDKIRDAYGSVKPDEKENAGYITG